MSQSRGVGPGFMIRDSRPKRARSSGSTLAAVRSDKGAVDPDARLELVVKDGEVRLEVHAKPRARKSAIVGVRDGRLEVAIAAPPVDGAANEELVATLARALSVPKSSVRIARGQGGRHKMVAIVGVTEAEAREILERG
jgi:uncharacterized protein (TIGR00251 family)